VKSWDLIPSDFILRFVVGRVAQKWIFSQVNSFHSDECDGI
jgi:hypothetical protein